MPTLGEACQTLRIGRVTLDKWIKRLGIETTRHEWDYRYQLIAPEDVERIAEARRKLPGSQRAPHAPVTRSEGRQAALRPSPVSFPIPTASKRAETPLPDGMMSLTEVADTHGLLRYLTTFRRWRDEQGKLDYDPGAYGGEQGRFSVSRPLTRRGLAQFYALAHRRGDFTACPGCPHTEADSGEEQS